MTTKTYKWDAIRQKTLTTSTSIETRLGTTDYTEAVYILNNYIKEDAKLQTLLGGVFNIYPVVAEEPVGDTPSYPYIRYTTIPGVGPFWQVRTDIVRYMVGDTSYKRQGQILQRLIELTNIEESESPMATLKNDKYRIKSLLFLGGTNTTGPDQDNGLFERGINAEMIYLVIS